MTDTPAAEDGSTSTRIRLQKFLASCGLGSRRACEEIVTSGRVTVDGRPVAALGTSVDPSKQEIALDGEPLRIERKKYYALNKPRGVVCTNRDPAGRPRVVDLFPPGGPRLFPVGRLDEESEGLLIVTNDGDLSQKLAHPKYRIYRTYHVHVAGVPNRPTLESLREGAYFAEGRFRVHSAKLLKKQRQSAHVELILTEGHNREVRRLLARVGHKVMRLKRVAFGPIQLGRLKRGEFRTLTHAELAHLHEILERNQSGGGGRSPSKKSTSSGGGSTVKTSSARAPRSGGGGGARSKAPAQDKRRTGRADRRDERTRRGAGRTEQGRGRKPAR
ncbi:MAG: rRNA pseudouridine synthase [Planctomycetaceae bacterium]|nr:rRNA pseudouridine synthase [Planctomycetaceae bacterium]